MAENDSTEFVCPGCGSDYKMVRVKADADLPHGLIHCRVCKQPLAAIDGEFVVEIFPCAAGKSEAPRKTPRRGAGLRSDAVLLVIVVAPRTKAISWNVKVAL